MGRIEMAFDSQIQTDQIQILLELFHLQQPSAALPPF